MNQEIYQKSEFKILTWLQALRGGAALMVLFFHLSDHFALIRGSEYFVKLTRYGFSGVDIFFVLSGFVVYFSTVHLEGWRAFFKYVRWRFLRIYLSYWVALLLYAGVELYALGHDMPSAWILLKSFFLLTPKFDANWLPVAWSLVYELYFYIVLGLVMMARKERHVPILLLIMMFVTLWCAGWLLLRSNVVYAGLQPQRFLISGYSLEFFAGTLLAYITLHSSFINRKNFLNWILFAVVLGLGGFSIGSTHEFFDRVEIMRSFSFGLVGVAGLVMALALQASGVRTPVFFKMLGNWSFGIYLLHIPIIDYMATWRYRLSLVEPVYAAMVTISIVPVVVFASFLFYILVEKKVIFLSKSR